MTRALYGEYKNQFLQSKLKQKQKYKETFTDIVCVHVGIEPSPYFLKVKNADGTNAKDEDGTTNVLKRNPMDVFIRSVRNGQTR